ncbi:carbonic anhydrase [Paenibacillus sp. 1011MAR3C5]|uniref:beta-class carbonic anhydrase n=1 Tax=Paenibacillus sp. 1011MAR3C5 TaxID=1675787 RepID=UPI000E6D072C|nr:carbonic anhydrase [Paenibacillus sp. 1011MAR3C5]RJE86070.1 carbonic anhydrase [Paenibacillus sp. 1011MAR3C5]
MSIVPQLMAFNKTFVEEKQYEAYLTDKFPEKKIAILTCMDTRLVELLPKALNLRNGDAKFIKNAGAILTQPFGSAMRSILVAVYELGAREVLVIGHHGCGMTNLDTQGMIEKFSQHGIDPLAIETLENSGIRMEKFLRGFSSAEEGVMHSVRMIRKHPLFPKAIPVHGFVIDPETGELEVIVEDYQAE